MVVVDWSWTFVSKIKWLLVFKVLLIHFLCLSSLVLTTINSWVIWYHVWKLLKQSLCAHNDITIIDNDQYMTITCFHNFCSWYSYSSLRLQFAICYHLLSAIIYYLLSAIVYYLLFAIYIYFYKSSINISHNFHCFSYNAIQQHLSIINLFLTEVLNSVIMHNCQQNLMEVSCMLEMNSQL